MTRVSKKEQIVTAVRGAVVYTGLVAEKRAHADHYRGGAVIDHCAHVAAYSCREYVAWDRYRDSYYSKLSDLGIEI